VAHIFPWFYVQECLKRLLWVGVGFPSSFLKTDKHGLFKLDSEDYDEHVLYENGAINHESKDSLCFEINPTF